MDVFVGYTVIVTIYDVMIASYRLDFREMIAICMTCDKCVLAWHMFISHSIPLTSYRLT